VTWKSEVGVQLLIRSPRGIELTAAGRAFLDHARLALSEVEAAGEAARRAAYPAKASFVIGFLTGTELEWLPEALRILGGELPNIEIVTSSQTSPELADALLRRKIDAAFLRPAQQMPDLVFKPLIRNRSSPSCAATIGSLRFTRLARKISSAKHSSA